ncbi:MAG: ABC transporter permease [Rhodospirillales bacterium]|nr:MAG: ABC transporter permease [Rhodospirillales bacterium]
MVAGISFRRIGAVVLRHLYLFRSSWLRILDSIYWPAVQMVMWGFLSQFLALQTNYVAQAFGVLLSGLLLWEVLIRGNLSLSIAFLEEMWSRNLGHLFVSPLRPIELAAGIVTVSLLRTLLGMIPVSLLAWAFFGFSIYQIGPALLAFFLILQMFGWSVGLSMAGLIMRMGLSAETFAWAGIFILLPISGVYYPVSALPGWLQVVAWCVPTAYVFEGMRSILTQQVARWDLLAPAFGLSLLYLALGFRIFLWCFHLSRRDGTLLQQGE